LSSTDTQWKKKNIGAKDVPNVGSALRDGPHDQIPAVSSHFMAVAVVDLGMQMYGGDQQIH
jgi:hypothetical protein